MEMLNSREQWEAKPAAETVMLGHAFVRENNRWRRALTVPRMLDGVGTGNLCRLREQNHLWARVAGRDRARFRRGCIGEMAEERTKAREKRPTPDADAQRPTKDLAARRGTFTHEQFEAEVRPQLVDLLKPGTIVDWIMRESCFRSGSIMAMCRSTLTSIR